MNTALLIFEIVLIIIAYVILLRGLYKGYVNKNSKAIRSYTILLVIATAIVACLYFL